MRHLILILRIFFVLVLPILIGVGVFLFLKGAVIDPAKPGVTATAIFVIEPDSTFTVISDQLAREGYIKYPWVPKLLAKIKKIDTTKIRAGEYELSQGMSPSKIVTKLALGEVVTHRVTVTEGMTLRDITRTVAAAGLMPEAEFWKTLHDPVFLKRWNVGDSFEGYLFPETYLFVKPVKAEDIIRAMFKEGEKYWPIEYTNQAEKLRMSKHEVMTLASIIEKESGDPAEQPLISAVFHNRLAQGMKLQADPTVIYGIPNFNGNLTKEDLQRPSPYNTYVLDGLPKGPIANPGRMAIYAALFPAAVPYLYFVADGAGRHAFSVEFGDHNKAVKHLINLEKEAAAAPPSEPPVPPQEPVEITLRPTPKSPMIKLGKK